MALTNAQKVTLSQILRVTQLSLTDQINFMGVRLTAEVEAGIVAQIALWSAGAGTKTVKIHPMESNKGVETSPSATRADIINNIAILLDRPDWSGSSGVTSRIGRG